MSSTSSNPLPQSEAHSGSPEDSQTATPLTSLPSTPLNEREPDSDGIIHFTTKQGMASFENLVAMANYQEGLRGARKMVWRDRGQSVVELDTLEQCLEHAGRGGLRSATLAFSIRALVNLVLALIRIGRVPRDYRPAVIRHALFGADTWRFAAMLGTFTSLYKFLINALPILIPAMNPSSPPTFELPVPASVESAAPSCEDHSTSGPSTTPGIRAKRKARLSLSLSTRAQLVIIRKHVRRWHAALAGAIAGGLAIMCEKRSRRGIISQQMFVRGLQGSYNAFAAARNIKIPHGDVIVFSLACGQILYAFLLRPDTLPRSYTSWIAQASKVPIEAVRINHDLVRDHSINAKNVERILKRSDITPSNSSYLNYFRERFLSLPSLPNSESPYHALPSLPTPATVSPSHPGSWYFPFYAPCAAVHPALSSCSSVPLDRFFAVFKWMLPIYGALHFVPAVLFKREAFMKDPGKVLVRAGVGSMRSSAFLGVFVVIYQTIYCYKHKLHRLLTILRNSSSSPLFKNLPQACIDVLVSKPSFWFPGLAAGLSLFVEAKRRRGELAMYVLPKGLESAWVMARGKGWVFRTGKWGDVILAAVGMGMVMSAYQNDPQHLSGLVRRILYQFIGPN